MTGFKSQSKKNKVEEKNKYLSIGIHLKEQEKSDKAVSESSHTSRSPKVPAKALLFK